MQIAYTAIGEYPMPTIQARVDDNTVAALERIRLQLGLSTQTETLRLLIHLQDKRISLGPMGVASLPAVLDPLVFAPPIFPGRKKEGSAKTEDTGPPPEGGIVRREEPTEDPLQVLRIMCASARVKHNWDKVLGYVDEMFDGEGVDVVLGQTVVGLLREKGMPNIPLWLEEFAESSG